MKKTWCVFTGTTALLLASTCAFAAAASDISVKGAGDAGLLDKLRNGALAPAAAPSMSWPKADITVSSDTLLGIAKRDVSGGTKENLMPATQFLGLTADKMADGNLSLHLYGWGRTDLADNSYDTAKSTGNLTYGYLQYRFNSANANIRAGRFFIHEGIVNEQVDGVSARTDLPYGFGMSAFGGATVHGANINGESSDGKGDSLYGGRASYRYKGLLELGLSGVMESDAPKLVTHTSGNYRRVGGDVWLTPVKNVDFMGHTSYNTETSKVAEHAYILTVRPHRSLVFTGEFSQYNEQSYMYSWATFSKAALNPSLMSSSMGGSASYELNSNLTLSADYKHYVREFASADRFGGDLKLSFNDNSVRGGVGYHLLNAGAQFGIGTAPSASYQEVRCYIMRDSKSFFAAVDLMGDMFKDKIYNKNSAWETTASLGYHVTPALALSGDFSYGRNLQFTEEARGLLRLTYNMNFSTGGKK